MAVDLFSERRKRALIYMTDKFINVHHAAVETGLLRGEYQHVVIAGFADLGNGVAVILVGNVLVKCINDTGIATTVTSGTAKAALLNGRCIVRPLITKSVIGLCQCKGIVSAVLCQIVGGNKIFRILTALRLAFVNKELHLYINLSI